MPRVINTAYAQHINSPAWRKKRLERLRYDNFKCVRCESSESLEVHHRTYERLGRELRSDLETLCHACHRREHGRDPDLAPVGGLSQRELTERGNSKYRLERWQEVVDHARRLDRTLMDLVIVARVDFEHTEVAATRRQFNELMEAIATQWGREWTPVWVAA